jgi:hypothetical protein
VQRQFKTSADIKPSKHALFVAGWDIVHTFLIDEPFQVKSMPCYIAYKFSSEVKENMLMISTL